MTREGSDVRFLRGARQQHGERLALKPEIRGEFDLLEQEFFAEGPSIKSASARVKSEFVEHCWRRAEEVTDRWIARLEQRKHLIRHEGYRAMWDRFNREASFPL
jgi:hypothetical protein